MHFMSKPCIRSLFFGKNLSAVVRRFVNATESVEINPGCKTAQKSVLLMYKISVGPM